MSELVKTKTFWAGVAAIAIGVGNYLNGAPALEALQEPVLGFIAIFLRAGMTKLPTKTAEETKKTGAT